MLGHMDENDVLNLEMERIHELLNRTTSSGTAQVLWKRLTELQEVLMQKVREKT
jgi:hypothetical protein